MPETARPNRPVRFGIFELDPSSGELRKDGAMQPRLQEQPLQVLLMLLERPGEVVTRDELRQRLWSSDTFVDFDHGLNTVINKLREVLGDSAANPRFIQTLPRRGYRFIAPAEIMDGPPSLRERTPASRDESGRSELAPASQAVSSETLARGDASAAQADSPPARASVLSDPRELPVAPRAVLRILFSLIQVMYLSFYLVSLAKLHGIEALLAGAVRNPLWLLAPLILTAVVGIPTRLYLLSGAIFDVSGLDNKFRKLFPLIFPLDELWALAPFLIARQIGFGLALAATAALLFLPFSQRNLLLMGYARARRTGGNE